MSGGSAFAYCSRCGRRVDLLKSRKTIQRPDEDVAIVEEQRRAADQRSRFEQVVFRLKTYVTEQEMTPPKCFISYAWGTPRARALGGAQPRY